MYVFVVHTTPVHVDGGVVLAAMHTNYKPFLYLFTIVLFCALLCVAVYTIMHGTELRLV